MGEGEETVTEHPEPEEEKAEHPELEEETAEHPDDDHLNNFTSTVTSLLLTNTSSNLILSPLSLYLALSTLRKHASGPTRAQLDQALGTPLSDNILSYVTSATKLWVDYTLCGDDIESSDSFSLGDLKVPKSNDLIECTGRGSPTLIINKDPCTDTTNNLVNRKDKPTLIVNTETFSHPEIDIVDFSKPTLAVDIINRWSDTATQSLIPECIDSTMINAQTRFIVSNAVLFSAKWSEVFQLNCTYSHAWNAGDGRTWDVPMMGDRLNTRYIPYHSEEKWHTVQLTYEDGKGHMMLVLPKEGLRLDEVKCEVIKRLGEVVRSEDWGVRQVQLSLPRFSFESSHDMNKVLHSVGLGSLTERCTLERFGEVVLDSVLQRAVIDLDETGTKVAAVTALELRTCCFTYSLSDPPIPFICDQPFMLAIVREGVVVFIGQVTEPAAVAEEGTWVEQIEAEKDQRRQQRREEAAERKRNRKNKCSLL